MLINTTKSNFIRTCKQQILHRAIAISHLIRNSIGSRELKTYTKVERALYTTHFISKRGQRLISPA